MAPKKKALFAKMLGSLKEESTVVELGMGTFPNAGFYAAAGLAAATLSASTRTIRWGATPR